MVCFSAKTPTATDVAWRDFARDGLSKQKIRRPSGGEIIPYTAKEIRDQSAGSQTISYPAGAEGGYFVPPSFNDRQLASMKQYDAIFDPENNQTITTENGQTLALPNTDDVSNESVLVGENTDPGKGNNVTFGTTQLNAYSFRTKRVMVSFELLQDANYNVGPLLERCFAIRHARGIGQYLINGTGVSQPGGLLPAAVEADNLTYAEGASANTGLAGDTMANSIGSADLYNTYFNLNKAYRVKRSGF